MKCSFCHAPLPLKGLICKYCNQLNRLNHKSITQTTNSDVISKYNCPLCQKKLVQIDEIHYCKKCDGLFITEEHLMEIVSKNVQKRTSNNSEILRFIQNHPRDNRKKTQYHPCPICQRPMQHLNYKKVSGVILDVCEEDGIWLDGGELRQIIEWEELT